MFELYYLGGEQGGWRTLLKDNGVTNLGLSYWSLVNGNRIPKKGLDIGSWGFDGVLLESGGYQANNKPEKNTQRGWRLYGEDYAEFVMEHIDDLSLVIEFDCLALGHEYIQDMRREVWSQIDPQKFLPVWHPEQGLPALDELGKNYPRVAVAEAAVTGGGLNVTPHLNALARRGVKLHGIAMTKPTILRQVAFTTAASTSWLSPMRFGDTQVWDNNSLTRYPMKMKQQARLRHQSLFEREGFDVDKLLADDKDEVTRLALWSWKQQELAIRALRSNSEVDRSNNAGVERTDVNTSTGELTVVTRGGDPRNAEMPQQPPQERAPEEIKHLPMFGGRQVEAMNTETKEVETITLLEVRPSSARACNTCVIKDRCPEFKPDTKCAFSIPAVVKTKEQRAAFVTSLIEIQAQRVQFLTLVEQVNGGYPDPNMSQEFDRMLKALQVQADLEDGRDFLKISVEARGKTGVLSRMFGAGNAERANPLPEPLEGEVLDKVTEKIMAGERVT